MAKADDGLKTSIGVASLPWRSPRSEAQRGLTYDDGLAVLLGLEPEDEPEDFFAESEEPLVELELLDESLVDVVLLDESELDELPLSEVDEESELLVGGLLAEFFPDRESFR